MGRPGIQAILVLLLSLALSHSSKGQANAAEQIEHPQQSYENTIFRVVRDAKRSSHTGRKRNNQNKNKSEWKRKKLGQAKRNRVKNKKKMGLNKNNRIKLPKKGRKDKKLFKKTMNKNQKPKRTTKRKKSRTEKNRSKTHKKESRLKKMKPRQKQKSKQNMKKIRTGSKSFKKKVKKDEFSKLEAKQACDEAVLCQKIKDYIKISNQLRKVRRIVKSCDTMDKKASKSAAEFEATVAALETAIGSRSGRRSKWRRASGTDNVTSIKDKLKNCSVTAKAKCQKSSVAPCQEEANLTKCETELQSWLTKFGPSKGSCLQASADCCACITALPDVSKDCLAFDKKSTLAVESKKKCTGGDEQGSFGFCRKLQIEAAEKGPKHAKDNCPLEKDHILVSIINNLAANNKKISVSGLVVTTCGTKKFTHKTEDPLTLKFKGHNCKVSIVTAKWAEDKRCEEFKSTSTNKDDSFNIVWIGHPRGPCKVEHEK